MVQSTYPSAPSRSGDPVSGVADQPRSANLSIPRLAIVLDTGSWSAARKLTQNRPDRWIAGQARDVFAGENSTSGGSSETDMKLSQVMPTGSPRLIAVTTVIPVAKRPSTSRNLRA